MKKLSRWGKANPLKARWIIAISHVLLVLNAVFLAVLLFVFEWGTSRWLFGVLANLFFIAYFFYPTKGVKKGWFRHSYIRQKSHDFTLVICYSLVVSLGLNNWFIQNDQLRVANQSGTPAFMAWEPAAKITKADRKKRRSAFKVKAKKFRKQIRKELRTLKKELKRSKGPTGIVVTKVFLILLSLLVAFILGYLIFALACTLSCSGQEGLALVVLMLGWGGIVWLSIITINAIIKKLKPEESP